MKHLCAALLGLLVLVVFAPACLAGDLLEGDGYTVKIPDGFREALSMSGNGNMRIKSSLGCLPIDGIPESTIYIYGDNTQPQGSIIVSAVKLKSGHEIDSIDDLGINQMEQMRSRLPEGFEVQPRKVGKYDAVEMTMEIEALGDVHTARILSIAAGDFVLVVMLQVIDDSFPAADMMWEQMVASIKIEKGLSKVVLYGGIGLGALLLVVFFARLSRGGAPDVMHLDPASERYLTPADSYAQPSQPTQPARPSTLPPALPNAPQTPAAPTLGAKAAPPRPQVAAPGARPGLRSTLPPSGHWEG